MKEGELRLETVPCGLCGSEDWTNILSTRDRNYGIPGCFRLVRCQTCGLIYQNPRPTADTLDMAYPENYGPHQTRANDQLETSPSRAASWKEAIKDRIADQFYFASQPGGLLRKLPILPFYLYARLLRVILTPVSHGVQSRVLDIGCGTGGFLAEMAADGWEVFGVEPNISATALARQRLGQDAVVVSLEPHSFQPGSFDLVTMWHVLEHLPDPMETVNQACHLLKPGGWLIAMTPNIDSLEYRVFLEDWFPLDLPRHLFHFSPHTLRELIARSGGLRVERIAHQIEPGTIAASLRNLHRRKPRARRLSSLSRSLWIPAVALAWMHTSGTMVVYARKVSDATGTVHGH